MTGSRMGPARERTVVVAAVAAEVFTRVADVGSRPAWSGSVGRIQLLRHVDPDLRSWSVERRLLTRSVPVVYHVAAMPPACVEVRVSIDGSGVVARYELDDEGDVTAVRITTARFCRGGRPSWRTARRLHRLARLLDRDDALLLPASARDGGRDVSQVAGSRHNRRA